MWYNSKGFPDGAKVKNPLANAGDTTDMGLIPGLGRHPGKGKGNSFQCSYLENSMDRGAWQAIIHGLKRTRQEWAHMHESNFTQ